VTFSLCQAWTTYSSRSKRLILLDYMPPVGIVKRGSYGDCAISPIIEEGKGEEGRGEGKNELEGYF
jgi:hypothetical protein